MKPLKLRQKIDGKWFYWGYIGDDQSFISPKNITIPSYQFTTQLDIDGKEIYEGHVLKCFEGDKSYVSDVKFIDDSFYVASRKGEYDTPISCLTKNDSKDYYCKIIGDLKNERD